MNYMATLNSLMILAGGRGTRFKEYTEDIPKPMIRAAGQPLLVHIINIYKKYGINNVLILGGYKQKVIIEYFTENYEVKNENEDEFIFEKDITVKILDTGEETMTGGRIKKGLEHINEESFYLTYGDGIADVDITKLTDFHIDNKANVTLTAVRPPARFGSIDIDDTKVKRFGEKDNTNEGWINGGFFVLNKGIDKYLSGSDCIFEKEPLEKIANEGGLFAYKHNSFWQCVDTIRELEILEAAFDSNKIVL